MSEVTWFKVLTDIFSDDKIKILQSMPEGDSLLVMWFKVLSQAGKTNDGGYIYLKKNIPYTTGMLSTLFGKQQQLVEFALRTFSEFGMIDIDEKGYVFVTNWEKHQSVDKLQRIKEKTKIRVQNHREKKKLELQDGNATVTLQVTQGNATEIDIDLEKDTTTTGNDVSEEDLTETVMEIHKKVFGTLFMNGLMSEYINKLKSQGYQDSFIKELMLETGESGNNPSIRLMETIGARWMKDGIYTRAESKRRHDEERKKVVSIQTKQQPTAAPKEFIPDPDLMARVRAANGDV
ncbi:phage replisome organizer N-terminal domain-containing protein [Paenibacillus alba]|uniref:Phage replisome organizer N-terminal domain-containing protein n=1 Tax=Paenibacillus alba TaxID=1197127 RepID=A0ABU6GB49_9BACL|nr:phage replisome organizer N-terminal domain-containing protein [Paenibacillus alba]MEC0231166.1 phage replisome organizer N-terminal domain-containing protein [Paenibacillus alba]